MQFIDLAAQYNCLKAQIDKRIQDVLEHGKYIMGPEVYELEEKLAEYIGVKHAVTCANGTDALQLALMVLGVGRGDAVFCPTFTFFATAEAPAFLGATPVFVDSDPATYNICPDDLERQIKKTISEGVYIPKAIIAVDLFGLPADYPRIEALAKKYKLKLIEDAAQGLGGEIGGRKSGSFGDISTTSFFPAKPLGCYGDGGAVFTDNDEYAELLRSYKIHGKGVDKYDNIRIGMNSRLDTIQAAILLVKLSEFPKELIARNFIAKQYGQHFSELYRVPVVPQSYTCSWAQYTMQSEQRDEALNVFAEKSIPTTVYYRTCLHQQTAFKGNSEESFPNAERLAESVFSLPMHPYLDVSKVL